MLREIPTEDETLAELARELRPELLPEDAVDLSELTDAVQSLRPDYRDALTLIYLQGMSYREAAQVMGKDMNQITHLAANGKNALRERLSR